MTLHTGPGCAIGPDVSQFSGSVVTPNCDVAAEGQAANVGCSIKDSSPQSYGAGLNEAGGAIFATEFNSAGISVWRFERGSAPADVLGDAPDPTTWGTPNAKFAGACDIDQMFAEQQIIIDTTFCGDWAGAETVWSNTSTGSCASKAPTCIDWVRDNPQAFTDAYWEIAALKVYKNDAAAPAPTGAVPSVSPVVPGQTIVPTPSPATPEVPPQSPAVPVASTPSPAAPVVPTPSPAAPEVPPQSPVVAPINAVPSPTPIREGGMSGFNWPQAGKRDDAPNPSDSSVGRSFIVFPTGGRWPQVAKRGDNPDAGKTSKPVPVVYPPGPTGARMARWPQAGKRDDAPNPSDSSVGRSFIAIPTGGMARWPQVAKRGDNPDAGKPSRFVPDVYPVGPTAARMARWPRSTSSSYPAGPTGARMARWPDVSSTSSSYPAGPTAARMARHNADHKRGVAQDRARV